MKGTLYLIPNFLGNPQKELLAPETVRLVHSLNEFVVESEKSARSFLKHLGHPAAQNQFILHLLDKHMPDQDISSYFSNCMKGGNLGLLSDAGVPCLADPGAHCVDFAHRNQIRIKPLDGMNAVLLALMASGFNGQQFRFHGYLPFESRLRTKLFNHMREGLKLGESQLFIEAPYRNIKLLEELPSRFHPEQMLLVASGISCPEERFDRRTLADWHSKHEYLHKTPAVFVLGVPPGLNRRN